MIAGLVSSWPAPSRAQSGAITRADYEACQTREEAQFRLAIEGITQRALKAGLSKLDYDALVAEQWRKGGVDEILDKRVDLAIAEIKDERSWGAILSTLIDKEKAQQLATAVAERVYRSDAMKQAIEGMAVGVGREIGRGIELATIDAGEPAMQCLQMFVGPRYGSTVARIVAQDAGRLFVIDPAKGTAAVSGGTLAMEGGEALTGAVLLIVRRQLANMAQRIGQRMVGAVLGRLVSTVAGGVGVVLIAKDIWDFRHGVMPIIATEMKSAETKEKVRAELAKALAEQISEHTRDIASDTAGRILDIWRDFQRAHAKVVDLAGRSEPFRKFLDLTKPEQLPRLDEVVALVIAAEGEDGVLKRLADGTLHQGVNTMPATAMEIARETRSLEAALGWVAIAGERNLPKVVEYEIHRRAKPKDFTSQSLARILSLADRVAVTRLASLTPEQRLPLLDLEESELKTLARGLTEDELGTLSRYLTGLERPASQRVLRAVAETPAKMQVLASARVRDAILASRDQLAAVGMMLRSEPLLDPFAINEDAKLVLDGKVSPVLLWDKHPVAISGGLVAALALLLFLKRLVFGRRVRVARG